jgi:hypothetical protein
VAEGGGLLNRYRINSPIVGSNPIPSATISLLFKSLRGLQKIIPTLIPTFMFGCPRLLAIINAQNSHLLSATGRLDARPVAPGVSLLGGLGNFRPRQQRFSKRLPLVPRQQSSVKGLVHGLHLHRPTIATRMLKPLRIMPARSCPGSVLKGQHDQLGIARSAFSHGNGLTLPEQQSLLAAFLHGLQKFWMSVLPVKSCTRGNTNGGGCSFQAEP